MNLKSIVFFALFTAITQALTTFTNLKCEDNDPTFATFSVCRLRVIRRNTVSLNIRVKLLKPPVTNSTISFGLYKKANGYKPFLYNASADICYFFAKPYKYPVFRVVYDMFSGATNINHTCPYSDDMIVDNLVLEDRAFKYFPAPEGDYLLKLLVYAYNDLKASVSVYVTRN